MANPYWRWLHRALYLALALSATAVAIHASRSRVGREPELDAVILYAVYYLLPYCLISLTCDLGVDAKGPVLFQSCSCRRSPTRSHSLG